jgi:hypothetical protein
VKKPAQPHSTDHPSDLLLPYVEGLLTRSEQDMVEEHLRGCAACVSEVEQLRETIALLGAHKEAFCPEEWELYEHVHYGADPNGLVGRHLQHCDSCREIVRTLTEQVSPKQMPDRLWHGVRQQFPSAERAPSPAQPDSESFFDRMYRMFRIPALGVGLATAVVLCFVLLRPPEMPQTVMALSSVAWENAPKPKTLQPSGKSTAIVLVLKDFDPPWPQNRIDKLYAALVPPVEVYDRFRVMPPGAVKESLDRSALALRDTTAVVAALAQKLGLTAVVVVRLTGSRQAASVQVEVIDARSGHVTSQETAAHVPGEELEPTIKRLALAALVPGQKETGAESR